MSAETVLKLLAEHDGASLSEIVDALLKVGGLTDALRTLGALHGGGFVSYDCRITLRLTPMGTALKQGLDK